MSRKANNLIIDRCKKYPIWRCQLNGKEKVVKLPNRNFIFNFCLQEEYSIHREKNWNGIYFLPLTFSALSIFQLTLQYLAKFLFSLAQKEIELQREYRENRRFKVETLIRKIFPSACVKKMSGNSGYSCCPPKNPDVISRKPSVIHDF